MNEKVLQDIRREIEIFEGNLLNSEIVTYTAKIIQTISEERVNSYRNVVVELLHNMIKYNASDIEIGGDGTNNMIWLRVEGIKRAIPEFGELKPLEANFLILSLLNKNQIESLIIERNIDFSFSIRNDEGKNFRFRGNIYFEMDKLAMNFRAISAQLRKLSTLGFHSNLVRMMSHQYVKAGLSLITGITGSGKSSTLDSIIDFHNSFDPAHIIILASPIEFVHKSYKCIIRHREIGKDVKSFQNGVVEAMRQDPDIIVIGEMRDQNTILAALEATDTGHKIFSTLHTSSAIETIDRIIAEVSPFEQERVRFRLADVLTSVISQKLVPTVSGKRILAKEVLIATPSVKAAIKSNNLNEIYGMIQQGGNLGMITLEQDLLRLFKERTISSETAISFSNNKTRMMQLLKAVE